MVGMFATSKSGHDKDSLYIILREEAEYVYVVDGKIRTLERPKKKNKKHIQIIKKHRDLTLTEALKEGSKVTDEQIKRAIKLLQMESKEL